MENSNTGAFGDMLAGLSYLGNTPQQSTDVQLKKAQIADANMRNAVMRRMLQLSGVGMDTAGTTPGNSNFPAPTGAGTTDSGARWDVPAGNPAAITPPGQSGGAGPAAAPAAPAAILPNKSSTSQEFTDLLGRKSAANTSLSVNTDLQPDQRRDREDFANQAPDYLNALNNLRTAIQSRNVVGSGLGGGGWAGHTAAWMKQELGLPQAASDLDAAALFRHRAAQMTSLFQKGMRQPGESQIEPSMKDIPDLTATPQVWDEWLKEEYKRTADRHAQTIQALKADPANMATPYAEPKLPPLVAPAAAGTSGITPPASTASESQAQSGGSEIPGSAGNELQSFGTIRRFASPQAARSANMKPGTKYQVLLNDGSMHDFVVGGAAKKP